MKPLTGRQQQVIELASRGLESPEIAKELGISLNTVKVHRENILRRTKSRTMVEAAVKYAYERKW